MAPYEYSALQKERSTRLLKILPGEEDAQLALELTEVKLDDEPVYDAISYTWGEDQCLQTIKINGQPYLIRPNIHIFFLELRRQGCTTQLWVDAVSIRQDDATEKGHQVHMIGDIFSRARRVLVWVGGHSSNSELLFRDRPGSQPRKEISPGEDLKRILVWENFMERPYWARLWIVQEVCLARAVIIYCGHSSASWAQLMRYHFTSWRVGRKLVWDDIQLDQFPPEQRSRHMLLAGENSFRNKFLIIMRLNHLRRMHHQSRLMRFIDGPGHGWTLQRQAHDLGFLVNSYRTQQCSDTRDRVFALLSLVDLRMQRLQPDYRMASAELLIQVCLRKTTEWSQNWMARLQSCEDDKILLFTIRITDRLLDTAQSAREALRLAASMHRKAAKSSQEGRTSRLILAVMRSAPWFFRVSDEWPSDVDFPIRNLKACSERLREEHAHNVTFHTHVDWRLGLCGSAVHVVE